MKKVKFLISHFDAGAEKFKAGEVHPVSDETSLCVARGAAEFVEAEDDPAGPTRADLDGMLKDLPDALAKGTAPAEAAVAATQLRTTFGDMLTEADVAAVEQTYRAAADAAAAKEAADKAATDQAAAGKAAADKPAADAAVATGASKSKK